MTLIKYRTVLFQAKFLTTSSVTQFLSRIPNPKDLDCMHLCSLKHLDTMSPPLLRRTNEARLSLHVPPIAIKRISLSCSYVDDINLSSDERK